MMLSTPTSSMPAAPASAPAAAQPAANDAAIPGVAAPGAAAPGAALPQQFAQWLGQQAAAQDLPGAVPDGAAAAPQPQDAPADEQADAAAAPAPDAALLAAMAMPLMPLSPAQVAQAVQAAQPAPAGRAEADADAKEAPALAVDAAGQEGGRRTAATSAAPLPAAVAAPSVPAPAAPAAPAEAAPRAAAQPDGAAVRLAVRADAAGTDGSDGAERPAAPAPAGAAPLAGAAPAAQPAPDTVKLAGPPTAWRQSLQEALGDRLQLQVGRNVEQAVIRLEPPQLGRIDIAIRHSAGVLEVNISASNGEVLRQLQAVGDNLRSDLSQRQYSEVAVTVAPTPRNGAAPFGDPQQQGRGRQQGRDQDESAPGRALADAGNPGSVFSLGGRE